MELWKYEMTQPWLKDTDLKVHRNFWLRSKEISEQLCESDRLDDEVHPGCMSHNPVVAQEYTSRCGWLTHVKAQHLLLTLLHCQPMPSFVLHPCFLSLTHYSDMETIFKCTDPSHSASYRSEHFTQYSRKQNWRTHQYTRTFQSL